VGVYLADGQGAVVDLKEEFVKKKVCIWGENTVTEPSRGDSNALNELWVTLVCVVWDGETLPLYMPLGMDLVMLEKLHLSTVRASECPVERSVSDASIMNESMSDSMKQIDVESLH
jgi:hypothetical protein